MNIDHGQEFARQDRIQAARDWILSRVNRPRTKFKPRLRRKYARK